MCHLGDCTTRVSSGVLAPIVCDMEADVADCVVCGCSDNNGGTEAHNADACGQAGSSNGIYDVSGALVQKFVCEKEISTTLCPPGFAFYQDRGTEGHHSCLFVTNAAASYSAVAALCPTGTHLLTIGSSSKFAGLEAFAGSITTSSFVGCSQSSTANLAGTGWSWVDGTPADNLNCGTAGCGVWNTGEPKYALLLFPGNRVFLFFLTGVLSLLAVVSFDFAVTSRVQRSCTLRTIAFLLLTATV
jgi:hypothetical protein